MELRNFDFSRKVFYHPERVAAHKAGERPFPVTVEIDLTNRCNHRCAFCYYAETVATDRSTLDTGVIKARLAEMRALGTRGVSLTGGGEPMLHKDFVEIMEHARAVGLDVGLITNGSAIGERNAEALVRTLSWLRVSAAGGNAESYRKVQGVDHFDRVLAGLGQACEARARLNSSTNIGVRMLGTPDNIATVPLLAARLAALGVDYLQVAPDQFTADEGAFWNAPETRAVFERAGAAMAGARTRLLTAGYVWHQDKLDYPRACHAHFFQFAVLADGHVAYCKNARGAEAFYIGDINQNTMTEIWNSETNRGIEAWCRPNNCGLFCKHIQMNVALEEALYPDPDMSPNFVG
ncbi:MAG: radical SAM protein [Alphaproteobacteria bacterium]|nr:radical SAM protein [Alphaproteobacteria bacterium]